jgi:hypothetical protein
MWIVVPLLSGALLSQQVLPVGVTRGNLVAWQGSPSAGSVTVRRPDGEVYGCLFDAHTLFQRDQWPIHVDALQSGETVEVVSDRKLGSTDCYARMLSVVYAAALPVRRGAPRPVALLPALRGYLTFSGLVLRATASAMTIRARDGDRTVLLRRDTRYSEDGLRLEDPGTLVNRHVFVRGGRTVSGEPEAYQVMWGHIFEAR